jgi:hypothetical protein
MLKKVLASLLASAFAVSVYAQAPKSDSAAPKSQPAPAAQPTAPGGSSATTAPIEKKGKAKAKKKSSKKSKAKAEDKK